MWSNPFYSFNNYFSQCRCEGKALKRKEWSEHISHLSVYASSVWPCKTACGSFRYPNQVGILATHHHVVCSFLCWRPGTISCHAWSDKLLSNRFCQSLPDNGFFFCPLYPSSLSPLAEYTVINENCPGAEWNIMCRECCEYDQIECVCPGRKEKVGYTIPCCRNEENECDSCLIHPGMLTVMLWSYKDSCWAMRAMGTWPGTLAAGSNSYQELFYQKCCPCSELLRQAWQIPKSDVTAGSPPGMSHRCSGLKCIPKVRREGLSEVWLVRREQSKRGEQGTGPYQKTLEPLELSPTCTSMHAQTP